MKDFLDKFFDICKEYKEEIPPRKITNVFREYVGSTSVAWEIIKSSKNFDKKFCLNKELISKNVIR